MRVILDTNVLLSLLLARGETMKALNRALRDGRFTLLMSPDLLAELRRILTGPYFRQEVNTEDREAFFRLLNAVGQRVVPRKPYPRFPADPNDEFLLALARDGHADVLITGDQALLEVGTEKTPHLPPRAFLDLLEREA